MEIDSASQRRSGFIARVKCKYADFAKKLKKVARDDPRRIMHSVKVGLALTIVSLLYYFRPLYDGFGPSAMWAVLTVVVVFEFTVGGTVSKCLNRGFATLVAGAMGVGAEYLAILGGRKGGPIILGLLVFFLAAASTFTRFIPQVKRYDYGVIIFILTFSLVAVSGYRVDQIVELANQRLSTILIGAATCMIITVFLCPVWAGEDLHNLIAGNIEKLASILEGIGGELFNFPDEENEENAAVHAVKDDKSFLQDCESILRTKATEESLANLAWWEPRHGRFRFCHPWKQYLKIGVVIRQCAYRIEALSGCIKPEPQAPSEIQRKVQQLCTKISSAAGKALKEMASSIRTMTHPSAVIEAHVQHSMSATEELRSVLETLSLKKADVMEIVQVVSLISILIEIIKCVERISEAVDELSNLARYLKKTETPKSQLLHRGIVKPVNDGDHVVITVGGSGTSHENDDPQVSKGGQHVGLA